MINLFKNLPVWILPGIFLCLLFLLLDTYGSTGTSVKIIGISSVTLSVLFFLLVLFSRFVTKWGFPPKLLKIISWILWSSLILAAILIISGDLAPDNYVYTLTRLNPSQLLIISHFFLALFLTGQSQKWWSVNLSKLIIFLPIWILFISFLVKLLPFDVFYSYAQEDGLIEYFQVLILAVIIYFSLKESFHDFSLSNKKRALFFLILSLAFLFILMEEISWGQRIFGWETNYLLEEVNIQKETNLHNIGLFNQFQSVVYIGISFFGLLLSLFKKFCRQFQGDYFWRPQSESWLLFLIILIFYLYFTFINQDPYLWSEIMELLLYFALMFWIYQGIYFNLQKATGRNNLK
jgi:hypothetical protein